MSSPALNWDAVASITNEVVTLLVPVIEAALPGAAEGVALASKIIQGILAAEPGAVSLFQQIRNGTPPTPAQLQQYEADYEQAYQRLRDDIAARRVT